MPEMGAQTANGEGLRCTFSACGLSPAPCRLREQGRGVRGPCRFTVSDFSVRRKP